MTDPTSSPFGLLARAPRRRSRSRIMAAGSVVVLAAFVIGGVAMADSSSSSASYRTALVSEQSVQQVLHSVAVVQPVRQASVAFPVSGTVQGVNVHVGDNVTTGAALAALSTDSLNAALTSKQAALAQAQLNLQKALNGQNPGASTGTGSGGSGAGSGGSVTPSAVGTATAFDAGPSGPSGGSGASGSAGGAPSGADIQAAQQAVLDAQKQVDTDLSAAQAALSNSSSVCAAVSQSSSSTVKPSDAAACQKALQTVLDDQQTVASDQAALVAASKHLNTLLDQAAAASGSSSSTTLPSTTGTGGAGGNRSGSSGGAASSSAGARSGSSSTSRSSAPSADDLIAYQRAVDAATDAVAVAQQAVDQATIVSPIAGTVEAVNMTPGDSVSAGSSTENIVVMGNGGYEVTTNVSVDQLPKVKVGQLSTVHPDGASAPIAGKVVSIGVAGATNSTTGSTVYPVTVGLTGDGSGLSNGATASVDIVTAASTKGLAVPTSAVTTLAGRHVVTVLSGGKAVITPVTIGAVGSTWTAIESGLQAGQKVALANLGEPLPGSATSQSSTGNATLDKLVSQFRQGGGTFPGGAGGGGGNGGFRQRTGG